VLVSARLLPRNRSRGEKKKATRLVAAGKPTRPDAARGGGMPKLTTLSEVHGVQNQPKTHILTRRRGADTAHTHKWDGLHTRHLLESTHTNKHTTWPDKVRCGLTPWRRPPYQRRAPRPHPHSKLHLCRDLPRRSYVHRHRQALCLQREPRRRSSTDQLTSFS